MLVLGQTSVIEVVSANVYHGLYNSELSSVSFFAAITRLTVTLVGLFVGGKLEER
jgi:hypothetical protein